MNTSKLKAIFTTACCFVVALCSEIKSMDAASDLQEKKSYKAKNTNSEGCLDSLKTEIGSDSSSARLLLNQDENKAPQTSWASYISYPVKSAINGTYNIADFAIKHPTQTIITSLVIASQFTAVIAANSTTETQGVNYGARTTLHPSVHPTPIPTPTPH